MSRSVGQSLSGRGPFPAVPRRFYYVEPRAACTPLALPLFSLDRCEKLIALNQAPWRPSLLCTCLQFPKSDTRWAGIGWHLRAFAHAPMGSCSVHRGLSLVATHGLPARHRHGRVYFAVTCTPGVPRVAAVGWFTQPPRGCLQKPITLLDFRFSARSPIILHSSSSGFPGLESQSSRPGPCL